MTDKNYTDTEAMQERVDARHRDHLNKVWEKVKKDSNDITEINQEVTALWGKAIQRDIDKEEREVLAIKEAEKAKAIKEIEDEYGRKSTKLQVAKQEEKDADLREMLRNINRRS